MVLLDLRAEMGRSGRPLRGGGTLATPVCSVTMSVLILSSSDSLTYVQYSSQTLPRTPCSFHRRRFKALRDLSPDEMRYAQTPGVKVVSQCTAMSNPHSASAVHTSAQCLPVPTGSLIAQLGFATTPVGTSRGHGSELFGPHAAEHQDPTMLATVRFSSSGRQPFAGS